MKRNVLIIVIIVLVIVAGIYFFGMGVREAKVHKEEVNNEQKE